MVYKHFVSDKNHCMQSMSINKMLMNVINCCKTTRTNIWQELIFFTNQELIQRISKFYSFIKRSSQVIHFLSTGQGSMDETLIP